jgi:aspartate aminotransferase
MAAFTPLAELDATVAAMVQAFQERRDLMVAALAQVPGVQCMKPEGAFYVFPNVTGLLGRTFDDGTTCATTQELTTYLLEKAYIGFVAGEAFGMPGYLRISYAQSNERLVEGMRRFEQAVT